ncbi:hypothetical protein SKAU_G00009450 [Synaphobranchus kaupii]|uniref:Uncharacterized protein n=1 Tax=Synaphobranchus kaupii TaxID=118154 RepID=A0A9Q1G9W9_SYNKA|nr:hypothetical protein SKAU_G00009450 [Synaphobranchus kaupii]
MGSEAFDGICCGRTRSSSRRTARPGGGACSRFLPRLTSLSVTVSTPMADRARLQRCFQRTQRNMDGVPAVSLPPCGSHLSLFRRYFVGSLKPENAVQAVDAREARRAIPVAHFKRY